jgi:hypothetical protein
MNAVINGFLTTDMTNGDDRTLVEHVLIKLETLNGIIILYYIIFS